MKKTVLSLTIGLVALCAFTMLNAVQADNELEFGEFESKPIQFKEDTSDLDLDLTIPELENAQTAQPQANTAPAKELTIAQNPAPAGAPAAPITDAVDGANTANILEAPALEAPAAKAPVQIPEIPAQAPAKPAAEPVIPQLPPVEKSIVKSPEPAETLPPAVTIDPTVDTVVPFDQPVVNQPLPTNSMVARGPAPIAAGGSCPNCPGGIGYGYGGPVTNRPVYYGVQRNGLPAYPRAGNCCGCGGCGCPGCCGRRGAPMPYPYYTLRGPRDFTDPNPRPIGP